MTDEELHQLRQAEVDCAYWKGRAEAMMEAVIGQPNLTAKQTAAPAAPGIDLGQILGMLNKLGSASKPRTDG